MATKHTIEENLERIADALEALTSAPAPAPDGSAPTAKATRKPRAAAKPEVAPAPAAPESAPAPAAPVAETPAPAPAPAAPAAPEAPAAEAVSRDQVREALRTFRTAHSKEDAIAILRKHGAQSVSDAPEAALPAILADFSK